MQRRQFRAVFDFGSGTTKMALCEKISSNSTKNSSIACWHTLFGEERETFVGYDVKRSGAKNVISAEVRAEVVTAVTTLLSQVREFEQRTQLEFKSIPACGFATAVYRECNNGRQTLDEISQLVGFPIHIISQKQEAISGFLTAAQLSSDVISYPEAVGRLPAHDELVSWDSGGSSFQIALGKKTSATAHQQRRKSADSTNNRTWQLQDIIEGPWGNSKVAHHFMADVQKKSEDDMAPGKATMNPCSADEFENLILHIKNDLKQKIRADEQEWLRLAVVDRKVPVVAIGGETSAFKLCSVVLGRSHDISPSDLRSIAHEKFIGKTDQNVLDAFKKEDKTIRQHHIAIGKLALLTAVMETFQIPRFSMFQSVGSTNGLAAMEDVWESNEKKNVSKL